MPAEKYETACQTLFEQAQHELSLGDARQAAERGWGAAAQAVKAVCESRGWRHHSHQLLRRAVARLGEETDDRILEAYWDSAQNLHKNFYEDFYNVEEVGRSLERVQEFIEKLRALD